MDHSVRLQAKDTVRKCVIGDRQMLRHAIGMAAQAHKAGLVYLADPSQDNETALWQAWIAFREVEGHKVMRRKAA